VDGDATARRQSAAGWRSLRWVALCAGLALRAYPIHLPYPQPEQEIPSGFAIKMLVRGDWRPEQLFHGTGFIYALRVIYTGMYVAGRVAGVYRDRLDFLASFVRDQFPYVFAGRLFCFAMSAVALVLAGRAAGALGGDAAAAAATALLAVTFVHVRESHYLWYDVPAATLVTATAVLGLRAVASGRRRDVLATAACGGAALATKHSMFAVAAPVLVTALLAGEAALGSRIRQVAAAAAVAVAAYAVCCPYTFIEFRTFLWSAWFTAAATQGLAGSNALPFRTLWWTVVGPGITAMALVGLAAGLRDDRRRTLVVAAFPVCYAAILASEGRLHARYLAAATPLAAALAGVGVTAIGRLAPSRAAGPATLALLALVALGPARQSIAYDRLLARPDTRALAAEWIFAHVPAGTRITLPIANGHLNPLLPLDEALVRIAWRPFADAILARGAVDRTREYPRWYLGGVFGNFAPDWQPRAGWIVTAETPGPTQRFATPAAYVERLRAAGARVAAEFRGFDPPLEDAVYDPIDANYVPLAGFDHVIRPGPNLTIWDVPAE
jgi:dolichyl-phosphate-mannose-protein mannosyltransferase